MKVSSLFVVNRNEAVYTSPTHTRKYKKIKGTWIRPIYNTDSLDEINIKYICMLEELQKEDQGKEDDHHE